MNLALVAKLLLQDYQWRSSSSVIATDIVPLGYRVTVDEGVYRVTLPKGLKRPQLK